LSKSENILMKYLNIYICLIKINYFNDVLNVIKEFLKFIYQCLKQQQIINTPIHPTVKTTNKATKAAIVGSNDSFWVTTKAGYNKINIT